MTEQQLKILRGALESLAALDERVQKLENHLLQLTTKWLPGVVNAVKELKTPGPAPAPKAARQPTTYSMWFRIQELNAEGLDSKQISAQVDVPPSTVRKYLSWSAGHVKTKQLEEFPTGVPEGMEAEKWIESK